MTCSGGDSSAAADEAARLGVEFAALAPSTARRLGELLPQTATLANPLDYTAMIWGDRARLRDLIVAMADDPGVAGLLVFYDEPADLKGDPKLSWDAVREGILEGAAGCGVPVLVSSTLPELLQEESADRFIRAGVPAIAGLRSGMACAAALVLPVGDPARLREIAAFSRRARARDGHAAVGRWLAEHEAKGLLQDAGVPVAPGRVAADEDDAAAILATLGPPVVAKLTAAGLRHKSELEAVALDLRTESEVRAAYHRLRSRGEGGVLVERQVPPGVELLVSARRDGVVPSLAVGLGGIWIEALDDAVVVPLPATARCVEQALRRLRGAPLLTGGRSRTELDLAAVAELVATAAATLLEADLELLELNPVVVNEQGASVVDALARTAGGSKRAPGCVGAPSIAAGGPRGAD